MKGGDITCFQINHNIRNLTNWMRGRQPGRCQKHLEEVDHICYVCKEPICKKCVVTTHGGHECVGMAELADNMASEVRGRKAALKKAKYRVERNLFDLDHNKKRALQELEQRMQSVKYFIEQANHDLADQIMDAYHRKEVNLKKQDQNLQSDLEGLEGLEKEEVSVSTYPP